MFKLCHPLLVTGGHGFDHCGVKLWKACLERRLDVGEILGCFNFYVLDLKNPARAAYADWDGCCTAPLFRNARAGRIARVSRLDIAKRLAAASCGFLRLSSVSQPTAELL